MHYTKRSGVFSLSPSKGERGPCVGKPKPLAKGLSTKRTSSPHPSPPSEGGEGEDGASWVVCAATTGNATHEITARSLSLSPSEGERVGLSVSGMKSPLMLQPR